MFKYYSSYVLFYFTLTHFLCCGIPVLLGIMSVFTSLLIFESLVVNFEFLEAFDIYLFALTSFLFLLIICFEVYKKKIKKKSESNYNGTQNLNLTRRKTRLNIIASLIIYVFNASVFFSERMF